MFCVDYQHNHTHCHHKTTPTDTIRPHPLTHTVPPAVIEGNEIVYRDYIDISVAVATPKVGCPAAH